MKSKMLLKEKAVHGTALIPASVLHLNYKGDLDNFFYLHWHDEFEFIVVLKGAIKYVVEGKVYRLFSGDGLFVQSNSLHSAWAVDGMDCEACVVLFHPNLFGGNDSGSDYTRFVYPILSGEKAFDEVFSPEKDWQRQVLEILAGLDAMSSRTAGNELLLKSRIFEIWHLCYKNSVCIRENSDKKSRYKIERLKPVIEFIRKNYAGEISLLELAQLLPMSEGQFCHTFKEVMHTSPVAYLKRFRILQSCTLLTETDRKIGDIARDVGFNNISFFNREFVKAVGCSPGEYRSE